MPFVARINGKLCTPFEADEMNLAECPRCGNRLGIRDSHYRDGAFAARHFWHPTAPPKDALAVQRGSLWNIGG